jgi:hypothetical protein
LTSLLYADPKVTPPRLAIVDAVNAELRLLMLPRQAGPASYALWELFPAGSVFIVPLDEGIRYC